MRRHHAQHKIVIINSCRRDKIAAVLVGIHTGVFLCLVIGATVVDQMNQSIYGLWLVLAIFSEVVMRITMEFFQVATIRDWIIEVCAFLFRIPTQLVYVNS
jgi:hypothetical protein